MARTYPTDFPALDPAHIADGTEILGGTDATTSDIKTLIEAQNWTYAHDAKGGFVLDTLQNGTGSALRQGYGSTLGPTTNAYATVLEAYVYATTEPGNNNTWRVVSECAAVDAGAGATAAAGYVKVDWYDGAGVKQETVETTHASGTTSVSTGTAASNTLDAATGYRLVVSLKTGTGAEAWIELRRLTVEPITVPTAALP
jgi:uncharacterized protein YodC (DUF2158 family)